MSDKKYKVTVEILGETYMLKSDSPPDKVIKAAALLNENMNKIAKANSRLSPVKISVLAGLTIADEYLRLEQDYQHLIQMLRDQNRQA